MSTLLLPRPRLGIRLGLWAALAAFGLISTAPWFAKGMYSLWMAFFVGSYRQAWINEGKLERRLVLLFIPLRTKRWSLDRFAQIETRWDEPSGFLSAMLFGPNVWILLRLNELFFDRVFPWLGGPCQLWLRAGSGKRVLAWQGHSEDDYRANLDLLQRVTGLPNVRK
jgi:hypothetical protein